MLDIKLIRESPDIVRDDLKKRGEKDKLKLLEELIEFDKKWRLSLKKLENLRHRKNEFTDKIAELKNQKKPIKKEIEEIKGISKKILNLEKSVLELQQKSRKILMVLPNILHKSVPAGKDETENVVIKKWGKPPRFDFKPKGHLEIALNLGLLDAERAAKASGAGFFYLKEELVLLDLAIQRFAIDFLRKRGYILVEPPFMINRKAYEGMIDPTDFEMVTFKIDKENLYLIATAEHPLGAMFMNEVFNKSELPLKLIGVSPCFRKEIGTHGKYTKGLFRMHQFNKVEQFVFCLPEQSWKLHEELQKDAEQLYQKLGLHYRVVNVCTGDIGTIAAKKYDTEIWMADGQYREIGSNSNCTDYQARRLNIRFRLGESQPVAGLVHTLNNTALATSRTMIAILEQHQRKDGSVAIPGVLRPYMDGLKVIGKTHK